MTTDATLTPYLEGQDGQRFYVAELKQDILPVKAGRHLFDYDGGVDLGGDPPPDGTYKVVATEQDAVGQIVERTATLTIAQGGKPYAQIVPQNSGVSVVF